MHPNQTPHHHLPNPSQYPQPAQPLQPPQQPQDQQAEQMLEYRPGQGSQQAANSHPRNTIFLLNNLAHLPTLLGKSYGDLRNVGRALENSSYVEYTMEKIGSMDVGKKDIFSKQISRLVNKYRNLFINILQQQTRRPNPKLPQTTSLATNPDQILLDPPQHPPQHAPESEPLAHDPAISHLERQIIKHYYNTNQSPERKVFFQDICRVVATKFRNVICLPTMLKTTLVGINEINKADKVANICLRIQVKVWVPGFSNFPNLYSQIFKNFRLKLKAQDISKHHSHTITFNPQTPNPPNISTQIYRNAVRYYNEVYKWRSYSFSHLEYPEKVEEFEGFVFVAQVDGYMVKLEGNTFRSPFELLDLRGIVEVLNIRTKIGQWEDMFFINDQNVKNFIINTSPNITLRFNLLSLYHPRTTTLTPHIMFNHIHTFSSIEKGSYSLAPKLMLQQTSNLRYSRYKVKSNIFRSRWDEVQLERIAEEKGMGTLLEEEVPVEHLFSFGKVHFHYPVYRHPGSTLLAIFVPMDILGLINLSFFFQEISLAGRLASITALLISLVTVIAILQKQVKSKIVSITEILIYLLIATPLLCLFQSLYSYFNDIQPMPQIRVLFWICVVVTALNIFVPLVMFGIFKCVEEPNYRMGIGFTKREEKELVLMPGSLEVDGFGVGGVVANGQGYMGEGNVWTPSSLNPGFQDPNNPYLPPNPNLQPTNPNLQPTIPTQYPNPNPPINIKIVNNNKHEYQTLQRIVIRNTLQYFLRLYESRLELYSRDREIENLFPYLQGCVRKRRRILLLKLENHEMRGEESFW